jgi:hypothetical protein
MGRYPPCPEHRDQADDGRQDHPQIVEARQVWHPFPVYRPQVAAPETVL